MSNLSQKVPALPSSNIYPLIQYNKDLMVVTGAEQPYISIGKIKENDNDISVISYLFPQLNLNIPGDTECLFGGVYSGKTLKEAIISSTDDTVFNTSAIKVFITATQGETSIYSNDFEISDIGNCVVKSGDNVTFNFGKYTIPLPIVELSDINNGNNNLFKPSKLIDKSDNNYTIGGIENVNLASDSVSEYINKDSENYPAIPYVSPVTNGEINILEPSDSSVNNRLILGGCNGPMFGEGTPYNISDYLKDSSSTLDLNTINTITLHVLIDDADTNTLLTYNYNITDPLSSSNAEESCYHSRKTLISSTEATCTESGKKVYKCSDCGQQIVETVPALDHNIVIKNQKDATITSEGYTGDKICDRCNTTIETGSIIPKIDHDHDWNDGTLTKSPTCTATGIKTVTCKLCGETKEVVVDALGHIEVTDAGKAPTCTETGLTEGKHCSRCNQVLIAQESISALGHNYQLNKSKSIEATPYHEGKEVYECQNCHDTYSYIIPKSNKNPDDGTGYVYNITEVGDRRTASLSMTDPSGNFYLIDGSNGNIIVDKVMWSNILQALAENKSIVQKDMHEPYTLLSEYTPLRPGIDYDVYSFITGKSNENIPVLVPNMLGFFSYNIDDTNDDGSNKYTDKYFKKGDLNYGCLPKLYIKNRPDGKYDLIIKGLCYSPNVSKVKETFEIPEHRVIEETTGKEVLIIDSFKYPIHLCEWPTANDLSDAEIYNPKITFKYSDAGFTPHITRHVDATSGEVSYKIEVNDINGSGIDVTMGEFKFQNRYLKNNGYLKLYYSEIAKLESYPISLLTGIEVEYFKDWIGDSSQWLQHPYMQMFDIAHDNMPDKDYDNAEKKVRFPGCMFGIVFKGRYSELQLNYNDSKYIGSGFNELKLRKYSSSSLPDLSSKEFMIGKDFNAQIGITKFKDAEFLSKCINTPDRSIFRSSGGRWEDISNDISSIAEFEDEDHISPDNIDGMKKFISKVTLFVQAMPSKISNSNDLLYKIWDKLWSSTFGCSYWYLLINMFELIDISSPYINKQTWNEEISLQIYNLIINVQEYAQLASDNINSNSISSMNIIRLFNYIDGYDVGFTSDCGYPEDPIYGWAYHTDIKTLLYPEDSEE